MGNSQNRSSQSRNHKPIYPERENQAFTSQFSLSHFVGNLSGRSFISLTSNQSVYSASRPWSRVSRRRWNDSTLKNPLEASKTAWPVAHKESIFLPEFPITTDLLQKEYVILRTIAKGAFGEVYKVKQIKEGKEYALKVLSKGQIVNENAVRQVKEEARIQTACGHHTFIAGAVARWQTKKRLYIDFLHNAGVIYRDLKPENIHDWTIHTASSSSKLSRACVMVSEYITEGELLAVLEKYGKLPEELVKIFIAEIAIALDFLHNAGVIYRDLKPENILLDSDYHVQLIDFGLSKWLSLGARTSTLCGTLKYMAPEVLSRESYGHAVDWWSLGVVACKMLTDDFPAPAVGVRAKDTDQANGEPSSEPRTHTAGRLNPGALPASASQLSNAARGLLLRLLDRDPRVRMRNLRQMQQSAFYMGFNFEHVKAKKVTPKSILLKCFPNGAPAERATNDIRMVSKTFTTFDQPTVV